MDDINKQIGYSKLLTARVLGSLSKEKKNTLEQWELIGTNKEVSKDILNAQNFSNWERKKRKLTRRRVACFFAAYGGFYQKIYKST